MNSGFAVRSEARFRMQEGQQRDIQLINIARIERRIGGAPQQCVQRQLPIGGLELRQNFGQDGALVFRALGAAAAGTRTTTAEAARLGQSIPPLVLRIKYQTGPPPQQISALADGGEGRAAVERTVREVDAWIDQALDTAAVPAGPGVFYAFQDPDERAAFVASRYRREIVVPRLTRSVDRFEDYKPLLQPLMDFFAARGRLPDVDELPETADVISALGSLKRAFRLIQSATGAEAWARSPPSEPRIF
jgi:hypothetical protein